MTFRVLLPGLIGAVLLPGQIDQASVKIDFNTALKSGAAAAEPGTAIDIGSLANVFDGVASTLARSANVNPMVVTLSFTHGVELRGSRALNTYHNSEWTLEAAGTAADLADRSGSYKMLVDRQAVANGSWGVAAFAATEAKLVRITFRRTTGDNYVHRNEWEL